MTDLEWDAEKAQLLVRFDPKVTDRAILQEIAESTDKGVLGTAYLFAFPEAAHASNCGSHGLALYNAVEATAGVVQINSFFSGDNQIEIVADAETATPQSIVGVLDNSAKQSH